VFLEKFLHFHLKKTWIGILTSLTLIAGGLWLAKGLRIDTDLKSLLPKNSPPVVAMDELSLKSGSSNDLIIILQGGSLQEKIRAAEGLTTHLIQEGFAKNVRYTTPKSFFEEKKYLFIPAPILENYLDQIQEERRKNAAITDPLGLEAVLEREKNQKPDGSSTQSPDDEAATEFAKDLLQRLKEMRPYYQTADGEFLAIRVIPKVDSFDLETNRKILRELDFILQSFDWNLYSEDIRTEILGSIPRHIHRYDSIVNDVEFGGWGILFILLIVSVYFRSLWASLILAPSLLAGLSAGLALVYLVEGRLNTISIFLILVVFGVGIEFGIHLWTRMLQERRFYGLEESLMRTWSTTGRATLTSAVALLSGFALLTLSSFQGFAQFGRVAIILMACTAGGTLIFLPSWIVLVESIRRFKSWPPSLADEIFLLSKKPESRWHEVFEKLLRPLSIFLIAISLILAILFLRFDYKFDEGIRERSVSAGQKASSEIFSERLKPSAIATFASLHESARFLEFYETNQKDYPHIGFMSGLSTFFPTDQEKRISLLRNISDDLEISWIRNWKDPEVREALLEIKDRAYDFEAYSIDEVPQELKDPFIAADASGEHLVFLFDIGGATDGRKSILFVEDLKRFFNDVEMNPLFSGHEVIFADIVTRVIREGPWLVLGMLILVFFICWLDFRSWKYAAVTMLPVLFGFLLTGLVLVLLRIQINFYNMVALASLGAMVVDNSIHFFHRYLHQKEMGEFNPVRTANLAISPSVVTCTLTSICGYGGMLFAHHTGIKSLGSVAVVGLICCLISAVVFFPAWLQKFSLPSQNQGLSNKDSSSDLRAKASE
jgi:predicted RND superfamily exporter protein